MCGKSKRCLKACPIRVRAERKFWRLYLDWLEMVPKMKANPQITPGEVAIHEAAIRDFESILES